MDNNINVKLSLMGEDYISELKKNLYEDELKEINSKFPLKENDIDIRKTYISKSNDIIEVGFFIRNSLNSDISMEQIPLTIIDNCGIVKLNKFFDFKGNGVIPAVSARHFVVKFEFEENEILEDLDGYTIGFGNMDNLNAFPSSETEIENIPLDISFDEEKNIRDFVGNLKTLNQNEVSLSLYKLNYTPHGCIVCKIIIRNGYDREIILNKLPITIVNDENIEIARKTFENSEKDIKIGGRKAMLVDFEFSPNEVLDKDANLSKCRIEYR